MSHLREQGRIVEALLISLKRLTPIAKWVLTTMLVIYAFSGIRTIQPNENALLLRLGKLQKDVHGPGFFAAFPSPFDEVIVFKTDAEFSLELEHWMATGKKRESFIRTREFSAEEKEERLVEEGSGRLMKEKLFGDFLNPETDGYTVTGDANVLQGLFTLRYRISQPFNYFSSGESVQPLLGQLTYRALTHQLASRNIDTSLTTDREAITKAVISSIQNEADKLKLGISISGMEIRSLTPPTQVLAAFESVMNARQFAKTILENAKAQRNKSLNDAKSRSSQILSRAKGYAQSLVSTAKGETSAFTSYYEEYQKSPSLHTDRLYWDTIDSVMREVNSRALLPSHKARPTIMVEPSPEFLR